MKEIPPIILPYGRALATSLSKDLNGRNWGMRMQIFVCVSGIQLCRYDDAAEIKAVRALRTKPLGGYVSETASEEARAGDEVR
jgi:hypothetical protein